MLLLARTDQDAPKHKGISFLIVPMDTLGITIRALPNMAGSHEFNEVFLEDVRVPVSNRLGEENRGWYTVVKTLDIERSGIAHIIALRKTVEELFDVIREDRDRFSPGTALRHELMDRLIETEVSTALAYRVVSMQVRGVQPNHESSASKMLSSDVSQRIGITGIKVAGMAGLLQRNQPWAPSMGRLGYRYLRCTIDTVAGGTNEIQRNIVATRGLGLPRE